jgi:predicted alpha/beta-fold hydrolase
MPLLSHSNYVKRPFYLRNGHLETIVPSLFFKVEAPGYKRERLELSDHDFIDLDWLKDEGNNKLLVVSHGLEGSSNRHYVRRTASYFHGKGWDVLAWNCRSCSGEMNRLPKFYHHGATEDLAAVLDKVFEKNSYETVVLYGVSMGGSMSIKYVGEDREISEKIKAVVSFSVPCNLKDSAEQLKLKSNRFYEKRFVGKLINKVKLKSEIHPEIDLEGIDQVSDFDTFHERFTIPIYGFNTMNEFYETASCDVYFDGLKVPVLVCNAENDPLLGEKCYPREYASRSEWLTLEIPRIGGHVGFTIPSDKNTYMEYRASSFLRSLEISA